MPDFVGTTIVIIFAIVFISFVFVVAFGAPFLPTHKPQVQIAFELINLQKGQTLVELGSGDGRVLKEAAKRGFTAIGYELNPLLVIYSRLATWRHRQQVTIIWGNYWHKKLPKSDGIFVFLLKAYMPRLDQKIVAEAHRPQKLVSYAFKIEGKKPVKTKKGLYLYEYK